MTGAAAKLFLLPGIGGDESPLAEFRAATEDRLGFQLLDYPDVDRPSSEIRDFELIVAHVLENIRELQPSGSIRLVGYSFGGQVAFESACRLQQEGRSVGLLALLDSRALTLKLPGSNRRVTNRDEPMGSALASVEFVSRLLIAAGLSEAVRACITPVGKLFGVKASEDLRRLILQNLRGRSLSGLRLGRFNGPILLFRASEQRILGLPADLGWSPHCTSVQAVELKGGHNSLFRSDYLATNVDLISSAIEDRIRAD